MFLKFAIELLGAIFPFGLGILLLLIKIKFIPVKKAPKDNEIFIKNHSFFLISSSIVLISWGGYLILKVIKQTI